MLGVDLSRDGWLLFSGRIIRLFSYGFLSIILALHLAAVGMTESEIGFLLTLTLLGDALLSLSITQVADRIGRRQMLMVSAGFMVLTGVVFALTTNPLFLILAAFIGTLSPTGHEVGPFLAIEQSALAHLTPASQRTHVFAWYNLVGSFAAALGSWSGGTLATSLQRAGHTPLGSYQALFALYAGLGVLLAVLFLFLSRHIEVEPVVSSTTSRFFGLHRSRGIIQKLSLLFIIDSFAGTLVVQSLMAYWFHVRFGVEPAALGSVFFGTNLLAGFSALVAARIAARIGLINTMVFTHLSANVFLLLTPLMPTFHLAVAMVLLRFSTAQMDVPTRQAFIMAVVAPDERSAASGIINLARTGASALGPIAAGAMFNASLMNMPFFLAGTMKIVYDLLLLWQFRHVRPLEEEGRPE
ncbi:MAG: MFS transporter [Deltaproteobacteria bacterium]|nr:MFS transporter [Deltaproteobacteria bacterium]